MTTAEEILNPIRAMSLRVNGSGDVVEFKSSSLMSAPPFDIRVGVNLSQIFSQDVVGKYHSAISAFDAGEESYGFRYFVQEGDEKRHFEVNGARCEGGYLFVIMNVSDDIRAEEEKERLYEQLRQGQKMEALGQLTGGIAHDFNNILASILGYADLTLDAVDAMGETDLVRYLTEVIDAGEKARDLIAQMLTFARAKPTEAIALMPTPMIKETVKMLKSAMPPAIELLVEADEDVPNIVFDPAQLHQIIVNLCINARDALEGKGRLKIGIAYHAQHDGMCVSCKQSFTGDLVEISVSDEGKGMEPVILEQIFEPFFSTKESGSSTGMGLAVVHGIVHEHHGHIAVETQPGSGTTFRLFFPAVTTNEEKGELSKAKSVMGKIDFSATIMVVDDEESIARLQGELLRSRGLNAVVFSDELHALDVFNEHPEKFDAILVDQAMPGMTGIEFAKEVFKTRPDFPVILCTAQGEKNYEPLAKEAGIRAYLTKPVPTDHLLAAVVEALKNNNE